MIFPHGQSRPAPPHSAVPRRLTRLRSLQPVAFTHPGTDAGARLNPSGPLAPEADEKLTSTLGARGYEAYEDLKGEWLRALKPKTGSGGP